jgi:hypothetical protein
MGYVYAIQFDDLSVKVGQASNAGKRIARHKSEAARFGRRIVQTWTAEVWDANGTEGRLIDFCLSHGTARPGTREYFTGVPWDTANWDMLSLPSGTAGVPWDDSSVGQQVSQDGASHGECPWDTCPTRSRTDSWDSECPSRDLCHRRGTEKPSHTGQREGSSGRDWERPTPGRFRKVDDWEIYAI